MNQYEKKIKKNKLYKEFADLLNGKLQLSHRELELLTFLIKINSEWQPRIEGEEKNLLSTDNRRLVMKETMINKSNLSKYINVLKDKGIVTHDGKQFYLNPMLVPIVGTVTKDEWNKMYDSLKKNSVNVMFNLVIEE